MNGHPYVEHPRDGLVHELCPCCGGDGQRDVWLGESCRSGLCVYCAGRGYILREAPPVGPREVAA